MERVHSVWLAGVMLVPSSGTELFYLSQDYQEEAVLHRSDHGLEGEKCRTASALPEASPEDCKRVD